jgi:hypothetical protein
MGIKVDQPTLLPCFGEHDIVMSHSDDPYFVPTATEADDYFGPPAKPSFLGAGERVFEFCGQHCFREDTSLACLKDIITGERFDLDIYEYDQLACVKNPSWRTLNEMEVLAWVAKGPE